MGSKNSKENEKDTEFTGPMGIMHDKYGSAATHQCRKWVKLGFPEKGTFSVNQMEKIETQLHAHEAMYRNNKNKWIPDWMALALWQKETLSRREKQARGEIKMNTAGSPPGNSVLSPVTSVLQSGSSLYPDPQQLASIHKVNMEPDCPACPPAYVPQAQAAASAPQLQAADSTGEQQRGPIAGPASGSAVSCSSATGELEMPFSPMQTRSAAQENIPETPVNSVYTSGATGQYPMLDCPNPQAGQDGEPPTARVCRHWKIAEMEGACEELPDATRAGGKRFMDKLDRLVRTWQPTSGELHHVFSKKLKLRWGEVKGDWDETLPFDDAPGSDYTKQISDLRARMIAQFPLKVNWEAIQQLVQGENEKLYNYLARLKETFDAHGGVEKPADLKEESEYENRLTRAFLGGMRKDLRNATKTVCVGWRHRRLQDLLVYAHHCEELERAKEQKEKKKLHLAQLQAYQGNRGGQQRQQRGRGKGKGRGGRRQGSGRSREQRPQSTQDDDVCNNCGLKGHWARGCRAQKNQRVSGNRDTAPPGDVTFRNPGGPPGFQDALRCSGEKEKLEEGGESAGFLQRSTSNSLPSWPIEVHGQTLNFVVDAGAGVSVISAKSWGEQPPPLSGKTMVSRDAGGGSYDGEIYCSLGGERYPSRFRNTFETCFSVFPRVSCKLARQRFNVQTGIGCRMYR